MSEKRSWYGKNRLDDPKVKFTISLTVDHPIENEVLKLIRTLPRGDISRFIRGLIAKGFVQIAEEQNLDISEALKKAQLIDSVLGVANKTSTIPVNVAESTQAINAVQLANESLNTRQAPVVPERIEVNTPVQPAPQNANSTGLSPFLQRKSDYLNEVESDSVNKSSSVQPNDVKF